MPYRRVVASRILITLCLLITVCLAILPIAAARVRVTSGIAVGFGLGFALVSRRKAAFGEPMAEIADELRAFSLEVREHEAVATAQAELEVNLRALRDLLYGRGDPRVENGKLFFGSCCINDSTALVDEVSARYGGSATIFLGDERIATTIVDRNGVRQIGTRLAAGPAYATTLEHGRTYSGEADIFGEPYITVYEPIIGSGGRAIGAIFVSVKKADTLRDVATQNNRSIETLAKGLRDLREIVSRRYLVVQDIVRQRFAVADGRRRQKAVEREVAAVNHSVVVALRGHSQEFVQRAAELSKRTEAQAATLEETAAALSLITSTVTETAQGVVEVRDRVAATLHAGEESNRVLLQTVSAMSRIDAVAQNIAKVVVVIDSLAHQTNLLALNAAIEAARAGAAGAGFSVVAGEVRALARRSAEAATQIRNLVASTANDIRRGVDLVSESGASLDLIVSKIAEIDAIIAHIAGAAQDEAASLAEINMAIGRLEQTTQANAAMVEETAAAGGLIAGEASRLETLARRMYGDPLDVEHMADKPAAPASRPSDVVPALHAVPPSPRPARRRTEHDGARETPVRRSRP